MCISAAAVMAISAGMTVAGTLAQGQAQKQAKDAQALEYDIQAEPTISINTGVAVERTGQLLATLGAVNSGTNWTWGI